MLIIKELEKIILDLPLQQSRLLRLFIEDFKAAHRKKKLKTYTMATKALADFKKGKSNSLWN